MGGAEVAGAVVAVVEVPELVCPNGLPAARADGLPRADEWLEVTPPGLVGCAVAALVEFALDIDPSVYLQGDA
jgi:hypothetical protein